MLNNNKNNTYYNAHKHSYNFIRGRGRVYINKISSFDIEHCIKFVFKINIPTFLGYLTYN